MTQPCSKTSQQVGVRRMHWVDQGRLEHKKIRRSEDSPLPQSIRIIIPLFSGGGEPLPLYEAVSLELN